MSEKRPCFCRSTSRHTRLRVYLNVDGQLDAVLSRVEKANAKVVLPKTPIGPAGFIAIVADTEGNHVGLNSRT